MTPESTRPGARSMQAGLGPNLERFLTRIEPSRIGGDEIHVSKLWDLCSRQHALTEKSHEVIRPAQRVRFDIGKAIHDLVRNQYLGPLGMLWGDWSCRRCDTEAVAQGLMPERCPRCEAPRYALHYRETRVTNGQLKIVGSVDGFEPHESRGLGVLEIKSCEGAVFNLLRRPMAPHVFQAQAYAWLAGAKWVRLLYVSTALQSGGFATKSPFKDFALPFDLRVPQQIERALSKLASGGERVCKSSSEPRAIMCPVRRPCWSL